MGVPLVRMKLLAFACGASFAGIMGVLFSAKQVFINPESFTFLESIGVLAMVILGGMGSIPGAIVGATVVRSEEHTSELQSPCNLVCRLLLEKKKKKHKKLTSQDDSSTSEYC